MSAGIVATYSRHLGIYTGEALEVRGSRLRGERGAIVSSRVIRASTDGMEGLLARLRTQAPAKNDEIARLATEIE